MSEERTEAEVLSGAPIEVNLGGRVYPLSPRVGRKYTRVMRHKLAELLGDVDQLVELMQAAMAKETTELSGGRLEAMASIVKRMTGPQIDEALDLVYEYAPNIAADREYLEENATDAEFMGALWAIIRLSYGPFVSALGLGAAARNGAT